MSWELSKENIQPIPQGRKMACLEAALTDQSLEQLARKRHEYEVELRAYNGDDPMSVWFRYIKWIQQSYPTASKESGLFQLCKKCIEIFHEDPKYRNDERFMHFWITYANMCNDHALEIFKVMYEKNIGIDLAVFYKAWSWALENHGNNSKANAVLMEGMNRDPRLKAELMIYYQKFEVRVAKQVCDGVADAEMQPEADPRRKAFSELKTHGKSRAAPVNRVGPATKQALQPITGMMSAPTGNQSSKKTQIYVDDGPNRYVKNSATSSSNVAHLIEQPQYAQENFKRPGQWNKVKVKSKGISTGTFESGSSCYNPTKPTTQIYVEDNQQNSEASTKSKPTCTYALSEIKHKPLSYIVEPFDPTKRPAYDKWRVYGGPEPMSFEEIRAIKFLAADKAREEQEMKKKCMKMEEELKQLRNAVNSKAENSSANSECQQPDVEMASPAKAKIQIYEDDEPMEDVVDCQPKNDAPVDQLQSSFSQVRINPELEKPQDPTSNNSTRTEMSIIRELWNGSLAEDLAQGETNAHDCDDLTFYNKKSSDNHQSKPKQQFLIYEDAEDKMLEDDEDKENCAPPGVVQPQETRHLTGILTTSTDFPSLETEKPKEPEMVMPTTPGQVPTHESVTPGFNQFPTETFTPGQNSMNSGQTCTFSSTQLYPSETNNFKPPEDLSIIMEASREYCSKSSISSSSSSNSSGHTFVTSKLHSHSAVNVSTIPENEPQEDCYDFISDKIDPFDDKVINIVLSRCDPLLSARQGYHQINGNLPPFANKSSNGTVVNLDGTAMLVHKEIAQGAYAEVHLATKDSHDSTKNIIKLQKPTCPWEFYICTEVTARLEQLGKPTNVLKAFATVNDAYFFDDGSLLVMDFHPFGTLLELVNLQFRNSSNTDLALFLIIQLLYILENLHAVDIIHADWKPDNILVSSAFSPDDIHADMFGENRKLNITLIDFGRSIDMKALPQGTEFNQVVTTEGFQTPEMRENRPWARQIDYYGFLVTVHTLLFGSYMDVHKKGDRWAFKNKIRRYWLGNKILEEMFDTLLNVPDCATVPDLSKFRIEMEKLLLTPQKLELLQRTFKDLQNNQLSSQN